MTPSLDLWPIGNCQVSALIDIAGRLVWGCVPRVDGDPMFSALLGGDEPTAGFWAIDLEDSVETTQEYQHNTPILVTRHRDLSGGEIEVIDFCPYFRRTGRSYRPVAFARIVRPIAGSPRIRVRLRPTCEWGNACGLRVGGSNHLRYLSGPMTMRLTTTAPIGLVVAEHTFRLEQPLHLVVSQFEFDG